MGLTSDCYNDRTAYRYAAIQSERVIYGVLTNGEGVRGVKLWSNLRGLDGRFATCFATELWDWPFHQRRCVARLDVNWR